jgi:SAM-dependent methyltransferase
LEADAVKWSEPDAGDIGLDLCCGSGDLAQLLARQVGATGQVYGVDFSSALLAIAEQRIKTSIRHFPSVGLKPTPSIYPLKTIISTRQPWDMDCEM